MERKTILSFIVLWQLGICENEPISTRLQEYCPFSTFNPQCPTGEVIVMEHALYGRMKVGSCIHRDYGNLGCQLDELPYFDKKCSGLNKCQVHIPDQDLTKSLTCLIIGFSPYLEASYYCERVLNIASLCTSPRKIDATSKTIVLSSSVSEATSCGLQSTPFIIQGKPGQNINISLTDFSAESSNMTSEPEICVTYGYILDTNDHVVTICGKKQRKRHLYTSTGHTIQIMIEKSILHDHKFLMYYKAIGCPDMTPPEYGWIQKDNDAITVGCYASEHKWQLKCIDNAWIGYVGKCSPAPLIMTTELQEISKEGVDHFDDVKEASDMKITRNHVLIVTIGCFTLILCCIVIIAGIYCTKRYQKEGQTSQDYDPQFPYNDQTFGGTLIYKPSVAGVSNQEAIMMLPSYTLSMPRNDLPPDVPKRNASMKSSFTNNINGQKDLLSDQEFEDNNCAVKYYVLENNGDSTGMDHSQMYQNI